jgi:acyl transferase domain-containing protein
VPVPDPEPVLLPGGWLVVVPAGLAGGELAQACVRALAARGAQVVAVEAAGPDAGVLADRIGQVVSGGPGVSGVVSLLGLAEAPVDRFPVVSQGLAGTLALVQALGNAGVMAPLWVLTCGAVAAGETEVLASPVQAQVWGLGRVAALEHPDRWGGLVDVPPVLEERAAARLCAVLAGCGEDQVAIRAAGIVGRRLVRAPLPRGDGQWKPRGSVLITGGTGAIAGHVARWLASRGATRVVLASRSGPAAPAMAAAAAQLAARGTRVDVISCDVAQRAAVAGLLAWMGADGLPLTTVMHTAGVLDDGVLDRLDTGRLATVLAAKAAGATHLDELTRDLNLDAFVLFSSAAAVLSTAGQGNYAAANAFLDALARNRHSRGLPAVSVAWGPWAGGGVAQANGAVRRRMRRGVLPEMDPGLALKALGQVLDGGNGVLAVMDVDWPQFVSARGAAQVAFLRDLPEIRQLARDPGGGADDNGSQFGGELAQRLSGAPPAEQDRILTELVRTKTAAILGHASAEAIGPDRAFSEVGFDSLTALEMRQAMSAATGLRLPATLLFDYPNPVQLARYLRAELLGIPAADTAVPAQVAAAEPVAIVGMGCRFPGGVSSPEDLWELLAAGGDGISGFPPDRGWDLENLVDPDRQHPGTSYAHEGGFLHGAGDFDPGFFGISPREARAMDPQQRLLLETAWEALERAGIDAASLRGSQTGVFVGASSWGYGAGQEEELAAHLVTGSATSVISGRVSYTFGLEGPAVTVDTACSSSLVTLHLACQALRTGECSLALAGGVVVMATPVGFVGFSQQQALAVDGRCKAFSAAADGMGMSEGVGMLVVERLSDARRNGHPVLAVVRGSAVNQDGASNGLTAPNGPSQQRVIRAALASAGLSADQVDAVEAHGTGTVLGDPIEAQALIATYGQDRPEDRPLWLGSVKSNIGHTQLAAGAAGVMKMVLAMRHQVLPRTLHAEEPSPHVDWSAGAVRLLTEPVPWPADGPPRRAGVSSFGISGTNAHVILEEPPADDAVPAETADRGVLASGSFAWLVSGRSPAGLAGQAGRLAEFVAARPDLDAVDVAWSLATSRSVFEYRAVVTGTSREELAAGLAAVAAGRPAPGAVTGAAGAGAGGRVVFVFPGQGGQWAGMGRDLAACSPVFAARLAECGRALAPFVNWDLEQVIAGAAGAPGLEAAEVVQPVLWAVMVSLAAVWQAAGVTPDAVAGHSQGEIAAACVAGILSLEDAARVVALRSRALAALAGRGAMASVAEPAGRVRERLAAWAGRLSVAAVNGPAVTVVSGEPGAVEELAAACVAEGVRAKVLPVDYASHCEQVKEIRWEVLAALDGLTPAAGRVPMVSAMTGEWIEGPELGAGYWYDSLRSAVEFDRTVRVLADAGHRAFIEVSPHPVLTAAITETLEDTVGPAEASQAGVPAVTGTLRRGDGGASRLLASLAEAYVQGTAVNWVAVLPAGRRVDLPTYAFQRQRYWLAAPILGRAPAGGDGAGSAAEARFWAAVEGGDVQALSGVLAVEDGQRLEQALPVLTAWRRRERDRSVTESWRYRVAWVPVPDPELTMLSGTWLVVAPAELADQDHVQGYVRALTARGAQALVARAVAGTHRAGLADGIARALGDAQAAGVVSLLALAEAPEPGYPVVAQGLAGTLALAQALGDAGVAAPLWVLTCGAVAAGSGDQVVSPAQAQVWGLGRVAGLEHPDRWGGLVDLPSVLDERAAARLCGVLAGCGEDQVAIRPAGVTARRLVRAPLPRREGQTRMPRGTVLVTGGTGAIGGHIARWLTGRGAPRVVLTSRSGPGAPGAAALAAQLAACGTGVDVIGCDVAQRSEVAGLLARIEAHGPALSAVVHAAGVGEAVALEDATLTELARVVGAKTTGAAHLDELTAGMSLDAFVLFSSIAATWGSGLQPGYAAANAFLDGLAERRRAQGRPATSVAWGAWGGGGMTDAEGAVQLRRRGLQLMDPVLAVKALEQVLDGGEGLVTVADVEWAQFVPSFTLRRPSPLIADLPEVRQALADAEGEPAAPETDSALAQQLEGLTEAEQMRMLTDLVRAEAAVVLGHPSPEAVPASRAFKDLGIDSLTAVEVRNRLVAATGLRLPATLVFDYPTSAVIADYLRTEIFHDEAANTVPVFTGLDQLESILSDIPAGSDVCADITVRLQTMLSNWISTQGAQPESAAASWLPSATADEVLSFIDKEFGSDAP